MRREGDMCRLQEETNALVARSGAILALPHTKPSGCPPSWKEGVKQQLSEEKT